MKYILINLVLFFSFLLAKENSSRNIQNIITGLPKSTKASVYIFDATTGKSIFKKNTDESMIPASNTKLFTTAAALNIMGPKHELVTNIMTNDVAIKDGIVEGNIYIKGFGHSTFTTKDLDSLVLLISKLDVKLIKGNIIADDSYFDKLYTRDDWIIDEKANVKLPPVSALVINKNQFVVSLNSTGKVGSKLRYSIKPECSFINVEMTAKVTGNRSRPRIKSSFSQKKIYVKISGGLRKSRTSRSYVVNIDTPPTLFCFIVKG